MKKLYFVVGLEQTYTFLDMAARHHFLLETGLLVSTPEDPMVLCEAKVSDEDHSKLESIIG